MNQMGFSELEFAAKKKRTRRDSFLGRIEAATAWALLVEQTTADRSLAGYYL